MQTPSVTDTVSEDAPPGSVKSIIPCTPLAIVKCLEYVGVYNKILPYGDRAYGKTVTIINRLVIQYPPSFMDCTVILDPRWLDALWQPCFQMMVPVSCR